MRRMFLLILTFVIILHSGCIFNMGDEGYTVSGTITTKDGEPLEGIIVCLGEMTIYTNSDGYYKFSKVEFNSYYIEVDPYKITKYTYQPNEYEVAVTKDTKIYFTASLRE